MSAPSDRPASPGNPSPEERRAAAQAATRKLAAVIGGFRELSEADRAVVLAAAGPAPCPDPCPPSAPAEERAAENRAAADRGAELWELPPEQAALKAKLAAAGVWVTAPRRPAEPRPDFEPIVVRGEPFSQTLKEDRESRDY